MHVPKMLLAHRILGIVVNRENQSKSPIPIRLRYARALQSVSQKGLVIAAGINEFSANARINQYETGKHTPDYSTAKRLADSLDVPVTYFVRR